SRQLGNVNYFTQQQTKELLEFKKRLGYDDVRFHQGEDCDLCGNNTFGRGYTEAAPAAACHCNGHGAKASTNGQATGANDLEDLVHLVTDQVMAALGGGKA